MRAATAPAAPTPATTGRAFTGAGAFFATRQAFMDGYSQAAGDGNAQIDTELLALFELEKALYELRYELNNRADWAQVPLNGVLALLQAERPG